MAESLAHGVPVVASTGILAALESRGCGRWVNNDPNSLAQAIKSLYSRDLEAMGHMGRSWIKSHHTWSEVGRISLISIKNSL